MFERRACRTMGQRRSTQRKVPQGQADEERLTDDIIELAAKYGRYGYRMVTGLLNNAGWHVNHKRVERIWRNEGLKVPQTQRKKGRLWLNDGSCVRLGSRLIDRQSQKMTVAARATAERKVFAHRS